MAERAASSGVQRGHWSDLAPPVAYGILALRVAVFVVEQDCPYLDLDGRDLEPTTEQRWLADPAGGAGVAAALRVLDDHDVSGARSIGRVVTRPDHRGRGLAAVLMRSVLDDAGDGPLTLKAQSRLEAWYEGFGFTASGPRFLEDGIPHTPMRRG